MSAIRSLQAASSIAAGCAFAAATIAQPMQAPGPAPAGQLEGRFAPARVPDAPEPLRAPRSNPGAPPRTPAEEMARFDELRTRNASDSWLWVTLYDAKGGFYAAGCIRPRQERTWTLRLAPAAYRVRAQIAGNDECRPPVRCENWFERRPDTRAIELRTTGKGCEWQPVRADADAKPALKGSGICHYYDIYNATDRTIWLTVYEWGVFRDEIIRTQCLRPGRRAGVWCYDYSVRFRAEITRNANCGQPVDCDTKKVTLENGATWDSADVKANPQTCWWQNGGHPYNWRDQLDK